MRKVDPAAVRDRFRRDADELMVYMGRSRRALEGGEHAKQDISQLAATTFLALFVAFEGFLSDLFLAYLNRDFSQYQRDLETRLRQSINERYGRWVNDRTRFEAVRHVPIAELEGIVDPSRRNLTFKDSETLKTCAVRWLSANHARRITAMSDHDKRLVDTAHAIRDFIAHRSADARKRMNQLLATVSQGPNNRSLGRAYKITNVGSYLKAIVEDQHRVAIYATRLRDIAANL